MIELAIFDLDLTLVDSTIAESYRRSRNWAAVYSLIPQFTVYDGFDEVFDFIKQNGIKVGIVSTGPSVYVQKVVDHFRFPVDFIVGYHDAPGKPAGDAFPISVAFPIR